jgi:two-component system, NtrC family, sensor kinase
VPHRLASKLILALALIVLIVKTFAMYINVTNQEARLLESMTLGADQLSRSITSATWQMMLADRRDAAYSVMHTIALKQGIDRIRMFNKDGELMFSTAPGESVLVDKRAEVCNPCHASSKPLVKVDVPNRARTYRDADGRRKMAMITPIYNEPSCSSASCHAHPAGVSVLGVLDLGINLSGVDQEIASIRARTLGLGLVEVVLIGVFIVFFTRHFVETPIQRLIDGTRAISDMKLDQPITIRSSVELEELSHSLNVMREHLQAAMAEKAQFTQRLETKVEERTAQLRAAQQKLIQADRLASLGQLAASVAHEINNPVSGVLNLAMLMQRILKEDGVPPGRIEEFRRYLGQVATETSRVGRIVSDLLSFSRRSKPQSADADLNAIITTTTSLIAHKLDLAGVAVDLELAEGLPTIRCDASQIQQVVMNLVLNGAEAIKGGGRVTVRTRTAANAAAVVLEVTDTGSGIPQELVAKIFDPFFTTKEEGKGVGLGLAVVYGIVNAHGGEIEVATSVGQGSTFRVTLPLKPPEPPPGPGDPGAGTQACPR